MIGTGRHAAPIEPIRTATRYKQNEPAGQIFRSQSMMDSNRHAAIRRHRHAAAIKRQHRRSTRNDNNRKEGAAAVRCHRTQEVLTSEFEVNQT